MLTEAGETFEQRETELQKLKDLVQEYEQKLESQVFDKLPPPLSQTHKGWPCYEKLFQPCNKKVSAATKVSSD